MYQINTLVMGVQVLHGNITHHPKTHEITTSAHRFWGLGIWMRCSWDCLNSMTFGTSIRMTHTWAVSPRAGFILIYIAGTWVQLKPLIRACSFSNHSSLDRQRTHEPRVPGGLSWPRHRSHPAGHLTQGWRRHLGYLRPILECLVWVQASLLVPGSC